MAEKKLGSGFLWLTSQAIIRQLLLFVLFVVLGRLLGPSEFGIVAIASATLTILQSVSSQGIAQAVVQREVLSDEHADVAFSINLVLCISFALLAWLGCAVAATIWTTDRQLILVLAVMVGLLPISAFYEIHQARLIKNFRFAMIAKKSLAGQVLGSVVAVIAAYYGYGVWSLVAQYYCMVLVELWIVRRWSNWKARLSFDPKVARAIVGFSAYLFGSRLVTAIETRSPELILGMFAGQIFVGYFRVARNLFNVIISIVALPLRNMALPVLSDLQRDSAKLRDNYLVLSCASAWLLLAPAALLMIWARPLVELLFGAKWAESGWVLQVIAIQGLAYALFGLYESLFVALGRTNEVFKLRCGQATILIVIMLLMTPSGASAIVVGHTVGTLMAMPLMYFFIVRAIGADVRTMLRYHLPPLVAAGIFISVSLVVRRLLIGWPELTVMLVGTAFATAIYLALFLISGDATLRSHIVAFIRREDPV